MTISMKIKNNIKAERCFLLMFVFWSLFTLPFFIENFGGFGFELPQNIIASTFMSLSVMVIIILKRNDCVYYSSQVPIFMLGTVILIVPLFYTNIKNISMIYWRELCVLGGFAFYLSLLQLKNTLSLRSSIIYTFLLSVSIQAFYGHLQLFYSQASQEFLYQSTAIRAYGIFQQTNVWSSFVCAGLGLSAVIFILPSYALKNKEIYRKSLLSIFIVWLSALIVINQSRIGIVGEIFILVSIVSVFYSRLTRQTVFVACLMSSGMLMAVCYLFFISDQSMIFSHKSSNLSRISMLRDTLLMIKEKPFLGWGYGSFEYNFQHFRFETIKNYNYTEIATHPHNEILYWWVEGGIVSLIGILILYFCMISIGLNALVSFKDAKEYSSYCTNAEMLGIYISIIPILLHTLTEYPFYISIPHWAVFLLFTSIVDNNNLSSKRFSSNCFGIKEVMLFFSMTITCILIIGFFTAKSLTSDERLNFTNFNKDNYTFIFDPFIQKERFRYDVEMDRLLRFNFNRDLSELYLYKEWSDRYLLEHIDAGVYSSSILVSLYLSDINGHAMLCKEAKYFFPTDYRFKHGSYGCSNV